MVRKWISFSRRGWAGVPTVTAIAAAFLIMGALATWDSGWVGISQAQNPDPAGKPASFAELAKRLGPTVVNIKVTKVTKIRGGMWPGSQEGPFGEFFKRFFEDVPRPPRERRQDGVGSGVIISEDGYILTNNHVVEGAEELTVTRADKEEFSAKLIGRDSKTDLAVLKIEATSPLPVAAMGDSEALQVGDWVLAIGNPFGLGHSVTSGIVSAKGRIIGAGPYDDFIQTDASINPGNSGGPLFNMRGEIVGINTAILPYGRGIGFAIPINTAKPLIPQMVSTGSVTRGYLGVIIQPITPELATALDLSEPKGALVSDVASGSPAEQGGMQRGDVVVRYKGEAVDQVRDLPAMVAKTPVGEEVEVIVLRKGQEKRLDITVGEFPSEDDESERQEPVSRGRWGLELRNITPEMARSGDLPTDQGVLVVGVQPDSPAAQAGIRQGDILQEVNRQPVTSVKDVKEALDQHNDEDSLLLLVQRGQRSLYMALAK